MDRISSLPNEIICHIGSFLSAKEAAFAVALSKRWRNLFNIVPDLNFDGLGNNGGSFTEFLDRVLALPVTSRVRKFSLLWDLEETEHAHINRCLCYVVKLGVLDLELRINVKKGRYYSLPFEVFTCKTVAKLILGYCFAIEFLPANAYLPALKSLSLSSIRFHDPCSFNTLLSASPVLEELFIFAFKERKWSRIVSSATIKRLTICFEKKFEDDDDDSEFESIGFDTPALAYLNYSDCVPEEYPIVNLNSIVEAKLNICVYGDYLPDPILFNGLKNVEILDLSFITMQLIDVLGEELPMFENLSRLSFESEKQHCWGGLRILLQKSPKLKTLTIKGSLHSDDQFEPLCKCLLGYSFLLTYRIEVLKITEFKGGIGEMLHLKHVLENLPFLELLEVHVQGYAKSERIKMIKIKKDLLNIPRASKCVIKVKFC